MTVFARGGGCEGEREAVPASRSKEGLVIIEGGQGGRSGAAGELEKKAAVFSPYNAGQLQGSEAGPAALDGVDYAICWTLWYAYAEPFLSRMWPAVRCHLKGTQE